MSGLATRVNCTVSFSLYLKPFPLKNATWLLIISSNFGRNIRLFVTFQRRLGFFIMRIPSAQIFIHVLNCKIQFVRINYKVGQDSDQALTLPNIYKSRWTWNEYRAYMNRVIEFISKLIDQRVRKWSHIRNDEIKMFPCLFKKMLFYLYKPAILLQPCIWFSLPLRAVNVRKWPSP